MKIISIDDAIKAITGWETDPTDEELELAIINLPTIEELKVGEWIEEYDEEAPLFLKRRWRCTACNNWQTYGRPKYCPNCGAKMKGTDL